MTTSYSTVIIGAGNAGVSLAAAMRRDGQTGLAIVDPDPVHQYRPMLNYAAASGARMKHYERAMSSVIPSGVDLLPHAATAIDPVAREVTLDSGVTLTYDSLVVCPGLTPRWNAVPGLRDGFATGWATSAHVPEYVEQAHARLSALREGTAVFSIPPEPASCGGTVLKAMFLACDTWLKAGVLERIDVHLVTPYSGILGLQPVDTRLKPVLERYGITVHEKSTVPAVDGPAGTVHLDGPGATSELTGVTLAYVTPPSQAPNVVADSGLGDGSEAGLVDVDPTTLRHNRYDSVWGLGDAATIDSRSSGGALRPQAAVVANNLRAARVGGTFTHYDGYTIVPIAISQDRLLLAEHTRDGSTAPTTSALDLTIARRLTFVFDRFFQSVIYFRWLLRGHV